MPLKMPEWLERYGDLNKLDPDSPEAHAVKRRQAEALKHPIPMHIGVGEADPDCEGCEGDINVCPLRGRNWRLCPHSGPAIAYGQRQEPWPQSQ